MEDSSAIQSEADPPNRTRVYSDPPASLETSQTRTQAEFGLSQVCGPSGVFCDPSEILRVIFPNRGEDEDIPLSVIPVAEHATDSGNGNVDNLTPPTSPVRRGRFLVWPVSSGNFRVASTPSSPGNCDEETHQIEWMITAWLTCQFLSALTAWVSAASPIKPFPDNNIYTISDRPNRINLGKAKPRRYLP